jgi:hypothetical protein
MRRGLPFAALAAAAAASAALIGGLAQAGEPVNQGGEPGEGGSATNYCRTSVPSEEDNAVQACKAIPGRPGEPGMAVEN